MALGSFFWCRMKKCFYSFEVDKSHSEFCVMIFRQFAPDRYDNYRIDSMFPASTFHFSCGGQLAEIVSYGKDEFEADIDYVEAMIHKIPNPPGVFQTKEEAHDWIVAALEKANYKYIPRDKLLRLTNLSE